MFWTSLIPGTILLLFIGILWVTIYVIKASNKSKKRRSPFTEKFLRGPGQSLFEKLDDINSNLNAYLAMLLIMPVLLYATYISELYFIKKVPSLFSAILYLSFGLIITGYMLFKVVRLFNLRRITRLGYDGEVAVGQELNKMMHHSYFVYHDFVAERFNIDHIVVGPAGVFAVETKTRAKPTSSNNTANAKVIYDGHYLQFPSRKESKALEQAKNQAVWLERWLSSATGEKTLVRPVLSLPGWFITRTASDGIPVINPKQFKSIAKPVNGIILDERRITSIIHQIEQRCRNIESKAVEGLGGSNFTQERSYHK